MSLEQNFNLGIDSMRDMSKNKEQYMEYLELQLEKMTSFVLFQQKENQKIHKQMEMVHKFQNKTQRMQQRLEMVEIYHQETFKVTEKLNQRFGALQGFKSRIQILEKSVQRQSEDIQQIGSMIAKDRKVSAIESVQVHEGKFHKEGVEQLSAVLEQELEAINRRLTKKLKKFQEKINKNDELLLKVTEIVTSSHGGAKKKSPNRSRSKSKSQSKAESQQKRSPKPVINLTHSGKNPLTNPLKPSPSINTNYSSKSISTSSRIQPGSQQEGSVKCQRYKLEENRYQMRSVSSFLPENNKGLENDRRVLAKSQFEMSGSEENGGKRKKKSGKKKGDRLGGNEHGSVKRKSKNHIQRAVDVDGVEKKSLKKLGRGSHCNGESSQLENLSIRSKTKSKSKSKSKSKRRSKNSPSVTAKITDDHKNRQRAQIKIPTTKEYLMYCDRVH